MSRTGLRFSSSIYLGATGGKGFLVGKNKKKGLAKFKHIFGAAINTITTNGGRGFLGLLSACSAVERKLNVCLKGDAIVDREIGDG